MSRHQSKRQRAHEGDGVHDATALAKASRCLLETPQESLDLLRQSTITGYQVVPTGSNYTFLTIMTPDEGEPFLAVYKPRQGENPLWDYPDGTLYKREHAAYVTSVELGWPSIPPTTTRDDGPFGVGMAQLYVPTDPRQDFFVFKEQRAAELMEISLFDILVNNGDRKAGHCLLGADGKVWAIDHGLTFNHATRLRTVLWDFCGEAVPERLLSRLREFLLDSALVGGLRRKLERDLGAADLDAFFQRMERIVRSGRYPQLDPDRNIPWPLV